MNQAKPLAHLSVVILLLMQINYVANAEEAVQSIFLQKGNGISVTSESFSGAPHLFDSRTAGDSSGIGYKLIEKYGSHLNFLGKNGIRFISFPASKHRQLLLISLDNETDYKYQELLIKSIDVMSPRFIVLDINEEDPTAAKKLVDEFLVVTKGHVDVVKQVGNTVALSTDLEKTWDKPILLLLDDKPWKPTGELAELMDRMEASCKASQEVFRKLSVEQMNFMPSNGSHTPRWNAEHMLGRQLGFFSQIFSTIDPSIKHVDLNPKQMPKDYVAAHPDWSGEQEAQLMQRVSDYVRCYVYLLKDINLDEPAPGSRWTLRRLLKQMDNHYTEHTANVKKKFELSDWPTQ